MKKITVLLFFFLIAGYGKADQLAWLSKDQAEQTISYFKDNTITEVILWCACCDNDPKTKLTITNFYYRAASDPAYYELVLVGKTQDGNTLNRAVDLAYVHVKIGNQAMCLGKELGFDCDPCTKPFRWF